MSKRFASELDDGEEEQQLNNEFDDEFGEHSNHHHHVPPPAPAQKRGRGRPELPKTILGEYEAADHLWRSHPMEIKNPADKRITPIEFTPKSFFAIINPNMFGNWIRVVSKGCRPFPNVTITFSVKTRRGGSNADSKYVRVEAVAQHDTVPTCCKFDLNRVFTLVHMGCYKQVAITFVRHTLKHLLNVSSSPPPIVSFYSSDICIDGDMLVTDTIKIPSVTTGVDQLAHSTASIQVTTKAIEASTSSSTRDLADELTVVSTLKCMQEHQYSISIPFGERMIRDEPTENNSNNTVLTIAPREDENGFKWVDTGVAYEKSSEPGVRSTSIELPADADMRAMYSLYVYSYREFYNCFQALNSCLISRDDQVSVCLSARSLEEQQQLMQRARDGDDDDDDELNTCNSPCLITGTSCCGGRAAMYINSKIQPLS